MEFFKYLLFGISGLSLIFWTCVIAIWHVYMIRRLFREDYTKDSPSGLFNDLEMKPSGLFDRSKYSLKSFVLADFTSIESDYYVNRLYTSMLISLGFMSFLFITYGLHSGMYKFIG